MNNIPFFSFDAMHTPLRKEMTKAFHEVYDSGWFVLGEQLAEIERKWAEYCGTKYAVTVADGLDALVIALQALEVGPGDEVIVPSNTYIASWLAVTQVGATIVPVEPDPDTFNITADAITKAITKKTKCVMPVNLYGQACRLSEIIEVAKSADIYVVEDNAQSQGATYKDKKAGSFGHINCTSFYPGKNLGALGEGGAMTTDGKDLAERSAVLRNYGSQKKYHNQYLGRNARFDELQAAFLLVKLKYLDQWNEERRRIANQYFDHLGDIEELSLPKIEEEAESVFHQFVIRCEQRDDVQARLKEAGIGTLIHYPIPPHLQPAYAHLGWKIGDFPIAERLAGTVLSLPIYPGLADRDIIRICDVIRSELQ